MLLRYIQEATLKKAEKKKQDNGYNQEIYNTIGVYEIQKQDLQDEISASIYGSNIYKMIKIKSSKGNLEKYLFEKVNNTSDNIRYYYIYIDNMKYKINAVNSTGIVLELV